uniref:Ubiquitin carboxyl-terminal hydrolase n=1 Tax=Timema bartmani TaxID=61472 RepID=A0A7R9I1L9_9NEOP|nr:unnamed protein product [Timema bartmani]
MADDVENVPDLKHQSEEIRRFLEMKMAKGQIWCLIDSKWFRNFKHYVGLDTTWTPQGGKEHPGPIDNKNLFENGDLNGELKDHMVDELDYVLLPEAAWQLLEQWYGLSPNQKPIKKEVVESGVFVKHCKVEVYLLKFKLCKDFDIKTQYTHKFSKALTIRSMEQLMREHYGIPKDTEARLWSCFSPNASNELTNPDSTIQDEGLFQDQVIVIDTRSANGEWHRPTRWLSYPSELVSNMTANSAATKMVTRRTVGDGSVNNEAESSSSSMYTSTQPGLCGLCNIGNTCFMNSVIQCMSNCPPITQYFLNGDHYEELNETNPLGMRGEIAKAFGELIKSLWSGTSTYTVPHHFKLQVGKFAPQFSGYQQQDSQELLTFLLDGLHEDLNRIKKKPYIEYKDSDSRPDSEVSKESWENYQKRNNSIIVDVFHGLLKSTVICPDCSKVSITFDPFCYLSLPLPQSRERYIDVTFMPYNPPAKPLRYKVTLPKKGKVQDLLDNVSRMCDVNTENLILAEVTKHHFRTVFSREDSLEHVDERDVLYVYELPVRDNNTDYHVIPVCHWEWHPESNHNLSQLFGVPFFVVVPHSNCTFAKLYETIITRLTHYINHVDNKNITMDSEDSPMSGSENNEDGSKESLKMGLFTVYNIDPSSTNAVRKLHNDGQAIRFPDEFDQQYLALQWTVDNRNKYFNNLADTRRHESLRTSKPSSSVLRLSDCMELYTTCEKLGADDAWFCPVCKKHQQATKKFDLWSLPDILIIHLKRFSYNRYKREKIDRVVEFPITGLDMSDYVIGKDDKSTIYDLIGVCNHYGGMGGGHYTAYAQNKLDRKWYCFDDSHVSAVSPDTIVSNAAYVLFYMRRKTPVRAMDVH